MRLHLFTEHTTRSVADVQDVMSRIQTTFSTCDARLKQPVIFTFEALRSLPDIAQAVDTFTNVSISGRINNKKSAFSELGAIVTRTVPSLGQMGTFRATVSFEETESKQKRLDKMDGVGLFKSPDKLEFTFWIGDNRFRGNAEGMAGYLNLIFKAAHVPAVAKARSGCYNVHGLEEGTVSVNFAGEDKGNPGSLRVECAGLTVDDLWSRVGAVVKSVSSGRTAGEWGISAVQHASNRELRHAYKLANALPAVSFTGSFSFFPISLAGIDSLRMLLPAREEMVAVLLSFQLPDAEGREMFLSAAASKRGYLLRLNAYDMGQAIVLNALFGTQFGIAK